METQLKCSACHGRDVNCMHCLNVVSTSGTTIPAYVREPAPAETLGGPPPSGRESTWTLERGKAGFAYLNAGAVTLAKVYLDTACTAAAELMASAPALKAEVERLKSQLTFQRAQKNQPWRVPYAKGVSRAAELGDVPHILASHCALHAAKSVGKLATVFEALDHDSRISSEQFDVIKAMSADLVTAALRFANLYAFDLADELERRVRLKNGVGFEGEAAIGAESAQ